MRQLKPKAFDLRDTETMLAELAAADGAPRPRPGDSQCRPWWQRAGLAPFPKTRLVAKAMADINIAAPVTAASLAADLMARRRSGQIVLVGSVAGDYPLPMARPMQGTKADTTRFAEALRVRMAET